LDYIKIGQSSAVSLYTFLHKANEFQNSVVEKLSQTKEEVFDEDYEE